MAFNLEEEVCKEFNNFSDIEEYAKEEAERYIMVPIENFIINNKNGKKFK